MHFVKVAAFGAALVAGANAACPGVIHGDCPGVLYKRSFAVEQMEDGQLNSGSGNAVNQINDGQLQVSNDNVAQQANDGQVQVPNAKQDKVTTVVDVVTETLAPKPATQFITVTGFR